MPRTIDDIATTTNTPSETPMIVSPARTLLARSWSSAIPTPSNAVRKRPASVMLFLPECFDGIEPRGSPGRIHAGYDADDGAKQRGHDQRPRRDGRWKR